MADEVNKDENRVDEGYTNFGSGGREGRHGTFFHPTGKLGQFFAKFFASKAQPTVAKMAKEDPASHLLGDTLPPSNKNVIKPDKKSTPALSLTMQRSTLQLPPVEKSRKERYKRFEEMDEYPEVGSAFDIYADDATQKNLFNDRWAVKTDSQLVSDEIKKLFRAIRLDRFYWDMIRNTVKYGDCFIETILDLNNPTLGIQRVKILNPNFVLRVENEYGYLTNFLQEIPTDEHNYSSYGGGGENSAKYVTLDRNQILHFRLHTSDPAYYPYGRSVGAHAIRIFRSLRLMEDAMLVYRLARAPERRIFYVDVGNMPATKAELFIERLKEKFKKEKFYNANTGNIDSRYNPLSADEDFFVPTRGGAGTKIETLQGAQNLSEVDDVKYFRDKLLAALKIPKDYIVEKDKSPERKSNLSQLDAKFARVVGRIQHSIEVGLEALAKRHLTLLGYPKSLYEDLRIELPVPSDVFAKRKLELDQLKSQTIQGVVGTGLFPKKTIYKEFYDMNDQQIAETMAELEEEQKKDADKQVEQAGDMAQAEAEGEAAGTPPEPPAPAPAAPAQEQADIGKTLEKLRERMKSNGGLDFEKDRILNRIEFRNNENSE